MKTWKLVSGILSIVLCVLVSFQSCAAGALNSMENNGEVSGSAGIIVAFLMLVGGIVSIAVKNSEGKGGDIALTVIFGLAGVLGITMAGTFADLKIWGGFCLICAAVAVVNLVKNKKQKEENE